MQHYFLHFYHQIVEASSPSNICSITRFSKLSELTDYVKDQQNFSLIKRGLLQLGFCAEKGIQMQLMNSTTGEDRFIVNIVDVPKLLNNPMKQRFGVFVVPQGRYVNMIFHLFFASTEFITIQIISAVYLCSVNLLL